MWQASDVLVRHVRAAIGAATLLPPRHRAVHSRDVSRLPLQHELDSGELSDRLGVQTGQAGPSDQGSGSVMGSTGKEESRLGSMVVDCELGGGVDVTSSSLRHGGGWVEVASCGWVPRTALTLRPRPALPPSPYFTLRP